jgi:hypothetical protein
MKWPLFRSRDSSSAEGSKHPETLQSQGVRKAPPTIADNPIRSAEADALGRDRSAQAFAVHLLSLDASEGVVVGVLGAWGSGKTSFVNLACTHLERAGVPVVSFNPWMFSGADQLVDAFFVEIAAQLKLRPELADLGDDLDEYGEAFSDLGWLPILGPWIERGRATAKLVAKILQRRREGIGGRRMKLWKKLSVLDKPLIVVLDDIDRLTTSEIRDIFKLVRLTANFPNVIYVVAFDRIRVESALAEEGIPGRAYLEKILQVALDLPAVPYQVLNAQILKAVNDALGGIENTGPFDELAWPDIFTEIIRPLISNMRDVRRYAAAIQGTVRDLDGQVALADVLALESVRVFLPDVFREVHAALEALTTPSGLDYGDRHGSTRLKEQINRLITAGGVYEGVARALVQRLFPSAERHLGGSHYGSEWKGTWIRKRKVAHEDMLRFYLERVVGEGLKAFTDTERAWACMADRQAFDSFLHSIEPSRWEDVISGLEAYEEEYRPEHVVPGTIVLLNLLPELPSRPRGMFDLDPRMVVGRVTYRLLRSLKDPNAIEGAVRSALPEITTLSAKSDLITQVGHREGAGHKLISEVSASQLEKDWRAEVRAAPASALVSEPELLRVLALTRRESEPGDPPLELPDLPDLTLALLRSAQSETRSQAMGSRAVRRSPRLAFDLLVELFGNEDILRERVEHLRRAEPQRASELLQLVDRYLGGWRPDAFDDD